jgi:hypothetical protein
VANFVPPMRLGAVLGLIVLQLFMPLWTFNGAALARGDTRWVVRTAAFMSVAGSSTVLVLGVLLTIASTEIMSAWMDRVFPDQYLILAGMTAYSTIVAFTSPYNMVLNAQGLARVQVAPWLAFVGLSFLIKCFVASSGAVWIIPAVSCACYGFALTPRISYVAKRSLRLRARTAST